MLTASFFSAVLGTKFPGKGSIYVSQSLEFKRPVYLGDVVAVSVVAKSVDIKRKRVVLDTLCYVLGKVTTTGSAELFIP
jgi:3-hydroxybutyryl-CoA dehydratase